jgi:DNA-binding transcriptional regulator YdaS (Cro superfamily)
MPFISKSKSICTAFVAAGLIPESRPEFRIALCLRGVSQLPGHRAVSLPSGMSGGTPCVALRCALPWEPADPAGAVPAPP